jgi:hypothetical protein
MDVNEMKVVVEKGRIILYPTTAQTCKSCGDYIGSEQLLDPALCISCSGAAIKLLTNSHYGKPTGYVDTDSVFPAIGD